MKRIYAFLTSAALLLSYGGTLPQETLVSAVQSLRTAADEAVSTGTAVLDETTGTLTLSGEVNAADVKAFAKNTAVKKVVAAKGTVLPEDCTKLFAEFGTAESFELADADTSKVTNMSQMFSNCKSAEVIDVSGFNTANVTNMNNMFVSCKAVKSLDVSGFDTSNVTIMTDMFAVCSALTALDVSNFDTSNVTSMAGMFYELDQIESLDISNFDTSNVRSMGSMFSRMRKLVSMDLTNFDTSSVTDIGFLFNECSALKSVDLSSFTTDQVTDMGYMFYNCKALEEIDLSTFETENVKDMHNMFNGCDSLKCINLAKFKTPKVENFENMFASCPELTTIIAANKFSMESIRGTAAWNMFKDDLKLVGGNGTLYSTYGGLLDSSYAHADCFEEPGYFTDPAGSLTPPPITDVSFDEATGVLTLSGEINVSHVWRYRKDERVKKIAAEKGTKFPPNCREIFAESSASEIDISQADSSLVTSVMLMFGNCKNLTSVNLDGFDTANVFNFSAMFRNCEKLPAVDVSQFDTSEALSLYGMFEGCAALETLDVSNFDTSKADDLDSMFEGCAKLEKLDLRNFDTRRCSNFSCMFDGCESLSDLDISSFRTPRATSMQFMFGGCSKLTSIDVSKFDTRHVKQFQGMFLNCTGLTTLDLSSFVQKPIEPVDISRMFGGCSQLQTIYVSDNWIPAQLTNKDDGTIGNHGRQSLFSGCTALKGGNGTAYTADESKAMMLSKFCIDSAEAPGYLTRGNGSVQPPEATFGTEFDAETGTLTIFGDFTPYDWQLQVDGFTNDITYYAKNDAVKTVVAKEGTILPPRSDYLFRDFMAESIDISKADASKAEQINGMFYQCPNLKTVNISGLDFSGADSMAHMFLGDAALESVDMTGCKTQNITTLEGMFTGCASLTSADCLRGMDTSSMKNLGGLFQNCTGLKDAEALKTLDLSKVETVARMFGYSGMEEIDWSGFSLPSVTEKGVTYLFDHCEQLKTVDFSGLKIPHVTELTSLFYYCGALEKVNLANMRLQIAGNAGSFHVRYFVC